MPKTTVTVCPDRIAGQDEKGENMDDIMSSREFDLLIDLMIDKLEKGESEDLLKLLKQTKQQMHLRAQKKNSDN